VSLRIVVVCLRCRLMMAVPRPPLHNSAHRRRAVCVNVGGEMTLIMASAVRWRLRFIGAHTRPRSLPSDVAVTPSVSAIPSLLCRREKRDALWNQESGRCKKGGHRTSLR
jgi:hypothetical protein